jgi:hypothetical protein
MRVAGSSGPASELSSEPGNLHTDHIVLQEPGDVHPHFPPFTISFYTVTCRVVRVTKITGSESNDWIY